jgi:hypothetical protein
MTTSPDMQASYPELAKAIARFQAFLGRQQWPQRTGWLQQSAVTTNGQLIVVNPDRLLSSDALESLYNQAAAGRLGVLLRALAHDEDISYCYLWAPTSKREAEEHMMPDGLKLSISATPGPIRTHTGLRFLWYRLRGPDSGGIQQLLT